MPARALFHTAPRCVEIRDLPAPQAAPGQVVVRTVYSGISGGTERLVFRGDVPEDVALDAAVAFRAVDDGAPELMHAVLTYDESGQL